MRGARSTSRIIPAQTKSVGKFSLGGQAIPIMKKNFNERVWAITKKIPRGKVSTYADLAQALGNPKASRAVGNALNRNPYSYSASGLPRRSSASAERRRVPCHRVVRSDGGLGGYASGINKKIAILKKEGVVVKNEKVDLGTFGYKLRMAKA